MGNAFLYGNGGSSEINGVDATFIAKEPLNKGDVVYTVDEVLKNEECGFPFQTVGVTSAFSPDGKVCVVSGGTNRIGIYSVEGVNLHFVRKLYSTAGTTTFTAAPSALAFSPDGNYLIVGGSFSGYAKIYSVSGVDITYVADIPADGVGTPLNSTVTAIAISPDGATLVLCGNFVNRAKVYSFSGGVATFVSTVYADGSSGVFNADIHAVKFSPSGNSLVMGGNFIYYAKVYSVSGSTITFVDNIKSDGSANFNSAVYSVTYAPDGNSLVLGGSFTGMAKIYSLSGTTVTYVSNIYANAGTDPLLSTVLGAVFCNEGTTLILGGEFTGRAKIYSVSGTTVAYVSDIVLPGWGVLSDRVNDISISPDERVIVCVGYFLPLAIVLEVKDSFVSFIQPIYGTTTVTTLPPGQNNVSAFSPNGQLLVVGGSFPGMIKVYRVHDSVVTYLYTLDYNLFWSMTAVKSICFSPKGDILVVGGSFTGRAKVFSVTGTQLTFVSDIYADAGTTALSSDVLTIDFSPSGSALVLGGDFTGRAKIYSVSGSTVTFVSNIYADGGTTVLSARVYRASFSPSGSGLVLCGTFTGRAKIYAVSGTTVTFVSNIYANAGTTALSSDVISASFSPSGSALVLGGNFTGNAKIYSVSGTTVTYVSDIKRSGDLSMGGNVAATAFSLDGTILFVGGGIKNFQYYSVSGTTLTHLNAPSWIPGAVTEIKCFREPTKVLVCGGFESYAKILAVSGQDVQLSRIAFKKRVINTNARYSEYSVGYAKQGADEGDSVKVRLL